jgi:hypothetical protein
MVLDRRPERVVQVAAPELGWLRLSPPPARTGDAGGGEDCGRPSQPAGEAEEITWPAWLRESGIWGP